MNEKKRRFNRRFKPEVRQPQIIEITKKLILENGLSWASSLRIAKALGIRQSGLYNHFNNKREILLATLSSIINEILLKINPPRSNENMENYIREAARTFYDIIIADPRQARLLIEYLCAPPTENMREEIQLIFSGLIDNAELLIKEGIAKGNFKENLDVNIIAWVFVSFSIAFSVGAMLEVPEMPSEERALRAIDFVLQAMKK